MYQVSVNQEQKVTYLGTVLDRTMTMSPHIEHLTQKATKSIGLLRFAAAQNVQQRSLLMLMKATVGSRLEYGLHLSVCASQQSMKKLQQVQNQAMRIVTGAAKPFPCNTRRYWLGLRSVNTRQKQLAAQAFLKATTTRSHPLFEHLKQEKTRQFSRD